MASGEGTRRKSYWYDDRFIEHFSIFLHCCKRSHAQQNIKRFEFYNFALCLPQINFVLFSAPSGLKEMKNTKFIFVTNVKFPLWSFSSSSIAAQTQKLTQISGSFLSDFWLKTLQKWNRFNFSSTSFYSSRLRCF